MDNMNLSLQKKIFLSESITLKYLLYKKYKKNRRSRTNALIYADRFVFGEFYHLYPQLRKNNALFKSYTRMAPETFDCIVQFITPEFDHQNTNFQVPISIEERLLVTIRYFATGLAFRQIAFSFRISKTAVSYIVVEVSKAIWNALKCKHMPTPSIDTFRNIAADFYEKWNFPNCVGSIDGKHIRVKCPKNSGSMYYNYKQFFSIVLMAVADANYRFLMIDVGAYGKDSDGSVMCNSKFYRRIDNGSLKLPDETILPNSNVLAPFVLIGDEAFPLRNYLMRPFPRKKSQDDEKAYYNYRLSRARMTIECAFGIVSSKFRILQRSIETKVENADHIVKAICVLHNIIIDLEKKDKTSTKNNVQVQSNDNDMTSCNHQMLALNSGGRSNNRATRTAIAIRNNFVNFFIENKI